MGRWQGPLLSAVQRATGDRCEGGARSRHLCDAACSLAPLLMRLGSNEGGTWKRGQPGAVKSGELSSVKGSTEELDLGRVRQRWPRAVPGQEETFSWDAGQWLHSVFLADASAVAAWGHCSSFPSCIKGPMKGGEEPAHPGGLAALLVGAEEAAGRTALRREKEAGRGESIAPRESCRQGKAENDKGSQALTCSLHAQDLLLSLCSQPCVPGPAGTVLQRLITASTSCLLPAPGLPGHLVF